MHTHRHIHTNTQNNRKRFLGLQNTKNTISENQIEIFGYRIGGSLIQPKRFTKKDLFLFCKTVEKILSYTLTRYLLLPLP